MGKSASGRILLTLTYDLNENLIRKKDVMRRIMEHRYYIAGI